VRLPTQTAAAKLTQRRPSTVRQRSRFRQHYGTG